ncbi:PTS system mannose/fructose/N-acetylgalactosamine-transporter subunit IIB [Breznakia pachnodae]|uniref:PTS system mannose-specific IIB component n=1 Tax=Breznakia pachnodae TaxID=265178 RepID=A0ABU0E0Y9_9FIRM|nr:PTS sugar transporter subunit IIB [Breznakia pachnodae]MDQ0360557.1 PTS system mannose-specific IIB component [Breznakia pachnodae]
MIKLVRIDDRLIHGQVALVWSKHLGINRIMVINDRSANNETLKATLKMACPGSIKCAVLTVEKGIETLNDPRCKDLNVFVVVDNPSDALELVNRVGFIDRVNFGNYGKTSNMEGKEKVTNNIFLDDVDKKQIHEIAAAGVYVFSQLLPDNEEVDLTTY